MIKCTDKEAKASEKVLDANIYHDWVVVEWTYEYSSPYPTTTVGSITLPMIAKKKSTMFMCKACGVTRSL